MKLLLDEMHAPSIAVKLAAEGWDVDAVARQPALRGLSDEDLLAHATADERLVVTENVADFTIIAIRWGVDERPHAGIVFTHPSRFNRATLAYPGNLLNALRTLLAEPPAIGSSSVLWLA